MAQRRDRSTLQNSLPLALLLALVLVGCGEEEADQSGTTVAGPGATATPGATPPAAPKIGGAPHTWALVSQRYLFQPTASDPNGDLLSFTIAGKPAWMTFSSATGRLTGTPTAGDVRTYPGITIQVSDGARYSTLQPFSVEVVSVGQSSITLAWIPPTENEDGSPLTDLAGYRIRYGVQSGQYDKVIELNNPGLSAYLMDGLVPSAYHVVMTAYNARGVESAYSNPKIVTLN